MQARVRPNKEALCLFERLVDIQNDETSLKQFVTEQQSHFKQVKAVRRHLCISLVYLFTRLLSMLIFAISGKNKLPDSVALNST